MEQDLVNYTYIISIIIVIFFSTSLTLYDDDTYYQEKNDVIVNVPGNDDSFLLYLNSTLGPLPIDGELQIPDEKLQPIPRIIHVTIDRTNHTSTEEAKLLAVVHQDSLYPDENLSKKISTDLSIIRETFGDYYPKIRNITYSPPWVPNEIIVSFEEEMWGKVQDGDYHAWDELNEEHNVTIEYRGHSKYPYYILAFEGIKHPRHLASLYADLPGVRYSEGNGIIGDHPSISLNQSETGIAYTFSHGWGDCPAGCIYEESWTFTVEKRYVEFLGYFTNLEETC